MSSETAAQVGHLNTQSDSAEINRDALDAMLAQQGQAFTRALKPEHQNLFSNAVIFVTAAQVGQMQAVITAVEEVVVKQPPPQPSPDGRGSALGVFYGYDFHLNLQGAHLIEINTNAGGAFLNALLIDSQCETPLDGTGLAQAHLDQVFIRMFRNEWRLERGDAPLKTIAIVDEQPELQYLYPEFLLAQKLFERAGIVTHIVDPAALQTGEDGLYCNGQRIDLIYNRLTDFDLQQYPHIQSAWKKRQVVLTPNSAHYSRYADKRKLAQLSDETWLRSEGASQASIDGLLQGVPVTRSVYAKDAEQWWPERKQWFFKPVSGYGGKGAYRGDKLTKRVFEQIMQADYVAQRLALPGEREVCVEGGAPQSLKYDVRCYVYDGQIQLIAARLYQGQTTNFRTPGGGFALVRQLS